MTHPNAAGKPEEKPAAAASAMVGDNRRPPTEANDDSLGVMDPPASRGPRTSDEEGTLGVVCSCWGW